MRHTKTHREMSEEGRLVEDVCKYTANGELSKTGSTACSSGCTLGSRLDVIKS